REARSRAHAKAAAPPQGNQHAHGPRRSRRLHDGADQPALQRGPDQARDRPGEGKEAARQARLDQGPRLESRQAAPDAPGYADPDGVAAAGVSVAAPGEGGPFSSTT